MNEIIDKTPNLSVISKIEVLSFNAGLEYTNLLTDFINDAIVIDLITATALVFDYTIILLPYTVLKKIMVCTVMQ